MIIYILITFPIIILIIFITKRKWSLLKKALISLSILIIYSLILCGLFVYLWNSSPSPREEAFKNQEYSETVLKKIILVNEKKEKILGEINFEYSQNEINVNKYDIVDYYNKESSFIINSKSQYFITLPIKVNDSINFPDKFSLTIRDSLQNIIKTYKQDDFFKSKSEINEQKSLENKEWKLIIE